MVETRIRARADVYKWGAVTSVGVIAGYVAVVLANARHFYTDDTESQYAPLWVMLGRNLREGRLPFLVPENWMAGNYTIEEAGLLNPPQLLIDLIAPSFDNLALYATLVKLIFAIILGLGVFRICVEYGSKPAWAAVAGVSIPFTGFLLFFDEASWITAFTGTAWMVQAWASAIRYARGKSGPIPTFVFLYLAMSVQYVFPSVESGLMIVAVAVGEVVYQRRWLPSVRLLAVSACAALAGLATYLPSLLTADVTWRGASEVKNDAFLAVPWSESLNASLPSTMPAFVSWWGYIQTMPMVYIAWFLIPALAFIDWGKARGTARELTAVGIFTVAVLMWTAGPSTIGPLRWPARVLPMVAIGLLLLVCILLGRYATTDNWRRRGAAAGILVGLLVIRSASAAPSLLEWHVISAVAVVALGAAMVWLGRTKGTAAACILAIVAVSPIAYAQVRAAQPTPMSWNLPESRSDMKAAFPDFDGTTLQLADRALITPDQRTLDGAYGSLAFGNYPKDLELTYTSGYTPNGHYYFGNLLCMRWDMSVCPDAFARAFSVEPETGRTLVDLMNVDRVVLQNALYPDARNHPAPDGWTWVDYPGHENYISVLERVDGPVSTRNGRISHTQGVEAISLAETNTSSTLRVSSRDGGTVVFARLGWPGYRATLNGQSVPIDVVAKAFVTVDVPAGTQDAELVLTWRPPGWKIGGASMVAGILGLGVLEWMYLRGRRRDRITNAANDAP